MRAFRKPLARKQAVKKSVMSEVYDLEEDREAIAALNRSWREMGVEEAVLFAEVDQAMKQLDVKKFV